MVLLAVSASVLRTFLFQERVNQKIEISYYSEKERLESRFTIPKWSHGDWNTQCWNVLICTVRYGTLSNIILCEHICKVFIWDRCKLKSNLTEVIEMLKLEETRYKNKNQQVDKSHLKDRDTHFEGFHSTRIGSIWFEECRVKSYQVWSGEGGRRRIRSRLIG